MLKGIPALISVKIMRFFKNIICWIFIALCENKDVMLPDGLPVVVGVLLLTGGRLSGLLAPNTGESWSSRMHIF